MALHTRSRSAQRGGRGSAEAGPSSATGTNTTPLGERDAPQLQTGVQLQVFADRIAQLEARLAATIQTAQQGSTAAPQQHMMQALIDGQRQANEVIARLVSRTWKPPTYVVEFSEDQDWLSYSEYLLPLCGHLDPTQEVRLIVEKAIRVPKGKKIPQHQHLPQLVWDQALKDSAANLQVDRCDLRIAQHARMALDRFYLEMKRRYPEKRSSLKIEAMRQELKRLRRKDESMESFVNALQKANLLLEKYRPDLKISEMELAQRVIDQINDTDASKAMNLETKKPGGRMDCNSLQEYVGWHWNELWKLPRFVTDEKEARAKEKAATEINAVTLKHCAICSKHGKPEAIVASHNTSDCRVQHNKRQGSFVPASLPPKRQRFARHCWYCKQNGHFMLSRDQTTVECPLLLAEFSRPKCHHPGCNGQDHIAQYHYQPQDRHRIEGNVVKSCKNVIISKQSGQDNKSSMVFAVEGLSEEEARARFEDGALIELDQ